MSFAYLWHDCWFVHLFCCSQTAWVHFAIRKTVHHQISLLAPAPGEGTTFLRMSTGILRDVVIAKKVPFQLKIRLYSPYYRCHLGYIYSWKNSCHHEIHFSYRSTAPHAQSASDSTAHEQLFSTAVKKEHFSHCSRTLAFQTVTFQPTFRQCYSGWFSCACVIRLALVARGQILGRNWDKSLKSFPPCFS